MTTNPATTNPATTNPAAANPAAANPATHNPATPNQMANNQVVNDLLMKAALNNKLANDKLAEARAAIISIQEFAKLIEHDSKDFSDDIIKIAQLIVPIMKNRELYNYYIRSECLRYDNADTAFASYHNMPESILVYFTDINRYGVCTIEQYRTIAKRIANSYDDGNLVTYNPRQIVLSSYKQKIVLLCSPQHKPKLETMIKTFFKSDVISNINSENETEIMILNKSEDNHAAVVKTFNEFCNFVYKQDTEIAANLSIPVLHQSSNDQYIYKNIGMHKIDPTVENLLKTLATVNPNITTLYVNINNIVGNDNIIGNNNVVEAAMDIVKDKYEIAKDWIIANPPFAKENKSIYYTRYKQANPNAIITNIFGKFVKNAGYNSIQGTTNRYWIKSLDY